MQPGFRFGVGWMLALLLVSPLLAQRPVTQTDALSDLAARFAAEAEALRGAEYHRLKSLRTGFWGQLHADPTRELMGVYPDGTPLIYTTCNVDAARSTRVNELHPGGASGYDRTGEGIWGVAVWDNGVADPNHQEFIGHVIIGDDGSNYAAHANHTCGTVAAAGVNSNARGMAYGAILTSFDWTSDNVEMAENADWLKISSHSYHTGSGSYGEYDYISEDLDEIMDLAPYYLACFAAANDGPGYNTIHPSSLAKNTLTVGAVHDVDEYTGPGSVQIAGFSSRGPCEDGRVKPDVVGNGINLYSTLANNQYTNMSGTSMSTPNVAGTSFVVLEHYMLTHDYESPLSSTLKAILIHTADECGGADGPDYVYGWGLVNAWAAADLISLDVDAPGTIQEIELPNGGTFSETVDVTGDEPLRVTIAWIDPPGNPISDISLVHDLDLRLIRQSDGAEFEPYTLNPDSPASAALPGDNDVDNVEMIHLAVPEAGEYTVVVNHEGSLTRPAQWFSLVMSGVATPEPVQLTLTPFTTEIGDDGGVLGYGVSLVNTTDESYQGQSFWTTAMLPNGNEVGPLFTSQTFMLQPGADIQVTTLTQTIPGYAPEGTYTFTGQVGDWPDVWLTDSFTFTKGLETAVGEGRADDWTHDGEWIVDETAAEAGVREAVRLTAWPNPFNSATRLRISLDRPGRVDVRVVNLAGREMLRIDGVTMNAGTHQISLSSEDWATGVYLASMTVDGRAAASMKLLHVK